MKRAKGLAKIPVIVTLLVLGAGGALQTKKPLVVEEKIITVETQAPQGEVPFIGEMTVTASRNGN